MLTVFPISNRVTDQVIMINSVFTIIINNIIISITIIFAVFIADEEDEGREAYLCASWTISAATPTTIFSSECQVGIFIIFLIWENLSNSFQHLKSIEQYLV